MDHVYYPFFGNLSNPLKLRIIIELKNNGEQSVLDLASKMKIEQSKLSHALASLKRCSIVQVKQSGKRRIYELNKETIVPILDIIEKHENKFCGKCRAGKGI